MNFSRGKEEQPHYALFISMCLNFSLQSNISKFDDFFLYVVFNFRLKTYIIQEICLSSPRFSTFTVHFVLFGSLGGCMVWWISDNPFGITLFGINSFRPYYEYLKLRESLSIEDITKSQLKHGNIVIMQA